MSKENNIDKFDSFFNEAFNSFEPTPPNGVFEAIQSQLGSMGATTVTTATIAKTGLGVASKIIIGVVATATIATATYFATQNSNQGNDATKQAEQTVDNQPLANTVNSNNLEGGNPANTFETTTNSTQANNLAASSTGEADGAETNVSSGYGNASAGSDFNSENIDQNPTQTGGIYNEQKNPSTTKGSEKDSPKTSENNQPKTIVGLYPSSQNICAHESVTFTIADNIATTKYIVDFGDGTTLQTAKGKLTTHKYTKQGIYTVKAKSLDNLKETVALQVAVNGVEAMFEVQNIEKGTYKFINKCQNGAYFNWFFNDGSEGVQEFSPTHTFRNFEPKNYSVKLIAISQSGCVDSFVKEVKQNYTYNEKKPVLYNVFSPGVDGKNDHYEIEIEDEEKYHVAILDKSGNKVFESTDKTLTWDGRNMYTGENCEAANYFVVFTYKIKGFEEKQEKLFIRLVR